MKKFYLSAVLGAGFFLGGCGAPPANAPDPTRQPWRDSWKSLPSAKAGDPVGLKRQFAAAKAQLMLPYVNAGEDAEAIMLNMIAVLESIGDEQFEQALLREDAETRSAVREFLFEKDVRAKFPLTHEVLVDAPLVKWPSDVAEEESVVEAGGVPPTRQRWTR